MKLRKLILSLAILNAVSAITIPFIMVAGIGIAHGVAISKYRDLQAHDVIVVSHSALARYQGGQIASSDPNNWSDIPEYILEGYSGLISLAWGLGIINGVTAVILILWLWQTRMQSASAFAVLQGDSAKIGISGDAAGKSRNV